MALELKGRVSLDGSGWERGLAQMSSSVKSFVATAFGIYGVQAAFRKTIDTASELVDASQRLGLGTEPLQILTKAAKDAGSSLDAVVGGFEKLEQARAKALRGGASGADALGAFARLGVTRQMLEKNTAQELFMGPIANAVKSIPPAELAAPLKEIFARGYGQLIPVLQTDFDDLGKTMKRLGAIMDAETAVALDAAADQFAILGSIITSHLGPAMLWLAETIYRLFGGVATSAAAAGAGTAQMGMKESAVAYTKAASIGLEGLYRRFRGESEDEVTRFIKDEMERAGFDVKAMESATANAAEKWQAPLDAMKKRIEEMADKVKNPMRSVFDIDEEEKQSKPRAVRLHRDSGGDALVRVGNFLGSNRGTLEGLALQQVNWLRQIAYNTTPRAAETGGVAYPP